jgi:DNA-binding transcriptional MerR regulator
VAEYTIGELVSLSGVNRRNVHFYVQQGLLPPPQGAGLGARYGDEHLLCLRAIPVLRNRGLRLDEIRERLAGSDARSIEAFLAESPRSASLAPVPRCGTMPKPANSAPAIPKAQHLVRYTLAPGVELLVDSANSTASAQVAELIQSAQKIFQTNPQHNGGKS